MSVLVARGAAIVQSEHGLPEITCSCELHWGGEAAGYSVRVTDLVSRRPNDVLHVILPSFDREIRTHQQAMRSGHES